MSNKKMIHRPLLYIDQPRIQFPSVIMQEVYTIKTAAKNDEIHLGEEAPPSESEAGVQPAFSEGNTGSIPTQKVMDKELEEEGTINLEGDKQTPEKSASPFDTRQRHKYSFRRTKNFKDLEIQEKLLYLENFPEQLSPVSCLYITPETTYIGILKSIGEVSIEIKLRDGSTVILAKDEIQEIRMLGFN
ncbi:CotO family spore coat protein [Bacillus sp. FJAT-27251]|uniref:CotO family spore coat protein n=1 Tax=Bacillus sp. FJAT-27251 TaxID=1684142 RepID=UPI0006A7A68F|nr:CotO family spore coat protein [Bacillus sp. FJAT-27251]